MSYTTMSRSDLRRLLEEASEAYRAREQQQAAADAARRARITTAVARLTDLLGPEQPTTVGQGSIREMLLYSDTDLQQHAGLAIRLILDGMAILTATARDVGTVRKTVCGGPV